MSINSSTYDVAATFFMPAGSTNGIQVQLAACGTVIKLLTAAPTLTYWRFRFLQYTNFAMMSIVAPLTGAGFGQTVKVDIPKTGDLMYWMYCVLQLPGIKACPAAGGCVPSQRFPSPVDPTNPCVQVDAEYFASINGGVSQWLATNYQSCGSYIDDCAADSCATGSSAVCDRPLYAHWTNAIGQFIIRRAVFMITTQTVDTLTNDFLFMWEELSGKPGKMLTEMIGKFETREELIAFSNAWRILYVPLPFYFTMTPGNALPLVAIWFGFPSITITFESLLRCVIVSHPNVEVVKCDGSGQLRDSDLTAAIETVQVALEQFERDRFGATWFEQLIVQNSYFVNQYCCGSIRASLGFAYTQIELIWALRRRCNANANNWFDYSGLLGFEPITAAAILFNSTERQPMRNGSWYRLVQPYQFHTNIPKACIYNYSFALYPEEPQPSGGACFSRLESCTLVIELQVGLEREDVMLIVIGRNLNIMKYRDGTATVVFQS